MSRLVVKVGGAVADASARRCSSSRREHEVCVVHGAGPQISPRWSAPGSRSSSSAAGASRRAEGLEIVRASFAAVNAALCAAIGERAVPLFGDEIGLAGRAGPRARPRRRARAVAAAGRADALDAGPDPGRRAARGRARST